MSRAAISPGWIVAAVIAAGAAFVDLRLAVLLALWLGAWFANARLSQVRGPVPRWLVPAIFGLTFLALWELAVRLFGISPVILPAPSAIAARIAASLPILWADFVQTAIKGALTGYVLGCGAAVVVAILIDRSTFLQRGLLPVGNFVAALPIVGIAPIMVMWFGFDWQSKAAVVIVMVFSRCW